MTEDQEVPRILLVDDDPEMLETLTDVLELKGYRVDATADREGTLGLLGRHRYDLILLDVLMPDFGGLEALREVRQLSQGATTMLMTGYDAMEDTLSQALAEGAHGVLFKPLELERIDQVMAARRSGEDGLMHSAVLDLRRFQVQPEALELLPEAFVREHLALPVRLEGDSLLVAMADPNDILTVDAIQARTGLWVRTVQAGAESIRAVLDGRYGGSEDRHPEPPPGGAREEGQGPEAAEPPAARTLRLLIAQGLRQRASDLHIEPAEDRVRVRLRVDGVLQEASSQPREVLEGLLGVIKALAGLDTAERRRPQEGRFSLSLDEHQVEVRAVTAGTLWGEMAVLRLVDRSLPLIPLEALGLSAESLEGYRGLLRSPWGMIAVAGPRSSGKTTTLYASLQELAGHGRQLVTIEDPVERRLEGINQIQVSPGEGVTWEAGLRSILHLDPDVILVGDLAEAEVAALAVRAALSGHLVPSSIQCSDAAGALARLRQMGLPDSLIGSALVGVLAQRLVRGVCRHCAEDVQLSPEESRVYTEELGEEPAQARAGRGCSRCAGTGLHGRTGLFELLIVEGEVRRRVQEGAPAEDILTRARAWGMVSLRREAMLKVREGVIAPAEALRSLPRRS